MDGLTIRKKRKDLGLTQKDLAIKLGVSYNTISNWERGEAIPLSKEKMLNDFVNNNIVNYESEKGVSNNTPQEPTGFYYPDVSAAAGMDKEIVNDELKRIPINLPNWEKGIDFINVYGDSMYPKYCSGEIIGVKQVELQYLNYGYAYVVILKDGQVMLKYIKKGCDNDHIILESENKFYEPKEYHLDQIKKVFIIKGVITKTTM
jgi:phage repressor protein C with HTH and peptisase S24 domain